MYGMVTKATFYPIALKTVKGYKQNVKSVSSVPQWPGLTFQRLFKDMYPRSKTSDLYQNFLNKFPLRLSNLGITFEDATQDFQNG